MAKITKSPPNQGISKSEGKQETQQQPSKTQTKNDDRGNSNIAPDKKSLSPGNVKSK